jgi:SM-20-related protein
MPNFIGVSESLALLRACEASFDQGEFRQAGVGRRGNPEVRQEIRGDHVLWIDPATTSPQQKVWLETLETLRLALNRRFFLGLDHYEGHFAIYPHGAFYKAHLDRHEGSSERIVTTILYLNEDWQPGDGGELKLWTTPGDTEGEFVLIEPRLGTLVCFLSGDFWHEVMPARKIRASITGWFRQR